MSRYQSRFWIGTLNNCKIALDQLMAQWHADGKIVYGIGQSEVGEKGTPHHQLYVVTTQRRNNKWMQTELFKGFWAKREGSHKQCKDYCTKIDSRVDGTTTEIGHWNEEMEGQGEIAKKKAASLMDVKADIDAGMHSDELWQKHFGHMLRYGKAFNAYRISKRETYRTEHTRALVLWGPTGTGKSHLALDIATKLYGNQEVYWYRPQFNKEWFDGYTGQKCCIFDEFYGQIPISTLLRFLDRYPLNVETKGSFVPFTSEMIIFTSNKDPKDWYRGKDGGDPTTSTSGVPAHVLAALDRRLTGRYGCVKEISEPYVDIDDDNITFEDELEVMLMEAKEREAKLDQLIQEGRDQQIVERLRQDPPFVDLAAEDEELGTSGDEEAFDEDEYVGATELDALGTPRHIHDDDEFENHAQDNGYVTARSLADDDTEEAPALGPPAKKARQAALKFAMPHTPSGVYCDCFVGDLPCDMLGQFKKVGRVQSVLAQSARMTSTPIPNGTDTTRQSIPLVRRSDLVDHDEDVDDK